MKKQIKTLIAAAIGFSLASFAQAGGIPIKYFTEIQSALPGLAGSPAAYVQDNLAAYSGRLGIQDVGVKEIDFLTQIGVTDTDGLDAFLVRADAKKILAEAELQGVKTNKTSLKGLKSYLKALGSVVEQVGMQRNSGDQSIPLPQLIRKAMEAKALKFNPIGKEIIKNYERAASDEGRKEITPEKRVNDAKRAEDILIFHRLFLEKGVQDDLDRIYPSLQILAEPARAAMKAHLLKTVDSDAEWLKANHLRMPEDRGSQIPASERDSGISFNPPMAQKLDASPSSQETGLGYSERENHREMVEAAGELLKKIWSQGPYSMQAYLSMDPKFDEYKSGREGNWWKIAAEHVKSMLEDPSAAGHSGAANKLLKILDSEITRYKSYVDNDPRLRSDFESRKEFNQSATRLLLLVKELAYIEKFREAGGLLVDIVDANAKKPTPLPTVLDYLNADPSLDDHLANLSMDCIVALNLTREALFGDSAKFVPSLAREVLHLIRLPAIKYRDYLAKDKNFPASVRTLLVQQTAKLINLLEDLS